MDSLGLAILTIDELSSLDVQNVESSCILLVLLILFGVSFFRSSTAYKCTCKHLCFLSCLNLPPPLSPSLSPSLSLLQVSPCSVGAPSLLPLSPLLSPLLPLPVSSCVQPLTRRICQQGRELHVYIRYSFVVSNTCAYTYMYMCTYIHLYMTNSSFQP